MEHMHVWSNFVAFFFPYDNRHPNHQGTDAGIIWPLLLYVLVMLGCFSVSIIHQTLTWTTWSSACLSDLYAHVTCLYSYSLICKCVLSCFFFQLSSFFVLFSWSDISFCVQDFTEYDVTVLIGAGIGVTPFASILKHIWWVEREKRVYVRECVCVCAHVCTHMCMWEKESADGWIDEWMIERESKRVFVHASPKWSHCMHT